MGYDICCKGCGYNYYTVGSGTWYKSGTVTRCPSYGYCCCCGANESNPSRSWSGNVVKIECASCSNLITVVTWSDWKNSSSERAGYCSGCKQNFRNKKESWNNLKSKASSCSWASVGWDGWSSYSSLCSAYFRIKCHAKSHSVYSGSCHSSISDYLGRSRCPECVRYEQTQSKSNFCPDYYTFSAPQWARVRKTIDAANWVWTECEIYCNSKHKHCLFNEDTLIDSSKSGGHFHREITTYLSMNECPKCKKAADDMKVEEEKKIEAAQLASDTLEKSTKFMGESKDIISQLDDIEIDVSGDCDSKTENIFDSDMLNDLEQKLDTFMKGASSNFAALEDTIANSKDLVDETCTLQTIQTQKKYQEIMAKVTKKKNEILKGKQIIRQQIKTANDELIKVTQSKMQSDAALVQAKKNENKLNDLGKGIESLHNDITLNGKERNANPEAAKEMDQKYDELLEKLQEKCIDNQEKCKGLDQVSGRIRKIRGKLIAHQSKNKYILECLSAEYKRLQETAQGIEVKYEQRAMYFMAVTCNLNEKMMDKFKEEDLHEDMEGILDLSVDELIEMGIRERICKKIMRNIQGFKDENH